MLILFAKFLHIEVKFFKSNFIFFQTTFGSETSCKAEVEVYEIDIKNLFSDNLMDQKFAEIFNKCSNEVGVDVKQNGSSC